jgi:uncharacterized membrane protein
MKLKNKKEYFEDNKKNRLPIGIYIISIIYLLGAIPSFILAVITIINPELIKKIPPFDQSNISYPEIFTIFSIILVVLAVLFIVVSIGLFKRKNWARISLAVFNLLNIIGGIFSILEKNYLSLINIFFNSIVLFYLIFSKKVKKVFSQQDSKNEKSHDSSLIQQPGDLRDYK